MMRTMATITVVCSLLISLCACANTIRGVGRDTANTVNAVQGQ